MSWEWNFDAPGDQRSVARLDKIQKASSQPEEFKIFTSTLSGALFLGLYIAWASMFFF